MFKNKVIIVLGMTMLISCSPDSPKESSELNSLAEYDISSINPSRSPYLCDDLVNSQGAKNALIACMEQAQSGNVHAQGRLGLLYASGALGEIDWVNAMNWFLLAAKQGDPEAQYVVSQSYQLGRGVDKNENESFYWLSKSANSNYVNAQTELGLRYLHGEGVTSNPALALKWLRSAAEQKDPRARYELALLFLEGKEVEKDIATAESLLLFCVQENYALAFMKLGDIYRLGLTGVLNPRKAVYWYEKAIEKEMKEAQYHVAKLILDGQLHAHYNPIMLLNLSAERGYKPAQLELAKQYSQGINTLVSERLAFQWYLQAANGEESDPEAQYQLGIIYIQGNSQQSQNIELGANYLKKSANRNFYPAKYALATLYLDGYPVLSDRYQAIDYLSESANKGLVDAQIKLAKVLIEFSLPQYDKAAMYWVSKAANQGSIEGRYLLACFYYDGIGNEVDYARAFQLFSELAIQKHHLSELKLGQMYYYGQGINKDIMQSKQYFVRSAEAGVSEAKNWISILAKEEIKDDPGVAINNESVIDEIY